MNDAMFISDANDWGRIDRDMILALRAFAPNGVFTPASRREYLRKVGDAPGNVEFANILFIDDDVMFVKNLSKEERPIVLGLLVHSYRVKARPKNYMVVRMALD